MTLTSPDLTMPFAGDDFTICGAGETSMTWIKTIAPPEAEGRLGRIYDRVRGPDGDVDLILQAHSLCPHSLEGHMALYKNVLHHTANRSPKWRLELVGVQVSLLNGCTYCVTHHAVGLARALGDEKRADDMLAALRTGDHTSFSAAEQAILAYTEALTRHPDRVSEEMIGAMRQAGLGDAEILETNQVAAYFAYANRTVLGLGVALEEAHIGRSPEDSDDISQWHHR